MAPGSVRTVGRDVTLSLLSSLIDAGDRPVVLEGEPGIGKTHLLDEAARHVAASGLLVWRACCDELDRTRPLGALAAAVPGLADTRVAQERGDLLDALAAQAAGEERLLVAAQRHVQKVLIEGTVLLVDDVQWADRASVLLLHRIARGKPRVRVVCAARRLPRSPELDALVRASTRIPLDPLAAADARALAETLTGPLSGDDAQIIDGAHGRPLLVLALAAALRDGDGTSAVASLDDAVARSVATVSPDAKHVLQVAAVQGARVALPLLAAVTRRPVADLLPLVGELLAAGLLHERGDDLVFSHDLVRETLHAAVPAAVRRALHVETARALEEAGAPLAVLAAHLAAGAEAGDAHAAVRLREAGVEVATHDPTAALALLRRAFEVARGTGEADRSDAELCVALAWCGDVAAADAIATRLLARSRNPAVRVLARRGLASALAFREQWAGAADHLALALDEGDVSPGQRARLLAELAYSEVLATNRSGAEEHARAALASAEATGDVATARLALSALALSAGSRGDCDAALVFADRALIMAGDDDAGIWDQARRLLSFYLAAKDRFDDARSLLEAGLADAQRRGFGWRCAHYRVALGVHALDAGDLDAADRHLTSALEELDADELSPVHCRSTRARIAVARGDVAEAEAELAAARGMLARMGEPGIRAAPVHVAAAELLVLQGRDVEALDELRRARAAVDAANASIGYLDVAPELVRLLVDTGAEDEAAEVLAVVETVAARLDAPAAHAHALLMRAHHSRLPEDYLTAAAAFGRSSRRLDYARACLHAAPVLVGARRHSDAIDVLDEAVRAAEACGADGVAARARAQLRELGVRPGARGRRTRASHGWDSLTPAERRVVDLVVEGLSNPDIAARLFISRATVESHLKRVYTKLGVTSRLQLIADANSRREPTPGR